jgi:cell division protein FtsB
MRNSLRKIALACVVLAGTSYGIMFLRSGHTLAAFEEKRRQIEQLEHENETLQRDLAAKQAHLDRLEKDPDELKLEIQNSLKLVSPGTKQFILQDGNAGDTPAPATETRQ